MDTLIQAYNDGADDLVLLTIFINGIIYVGKGIGPRCFAHEDIVFKNVSMATSCCWLLLLIFQFLQRLLENTKKENKDKLDKLFKLKEEGLLARQFQAWHGMTSAEAMTREKILISVVLSMNDKFTNKMLGTNECKVSLSMEEGIDVGLHWLYCCCKSYLLTGLQHRPFPSSKDLRGIDEKYGDEEESGSNEEDEDEED